MFYGTLAVVSADNLGSLLIGGFKESCMANRCCPHCFASREDAKKKVSSNVPIYALITFCFVVLRV